MPRGGARRGAGRPKGGIADTLYNQYQTVGDWINERCDGLVRAEANAASEARLDKIRPHYSAQVQLAREIPVPQRAGWLKSELFEDHEAGINIALQKDKGAMPADTTKLTDEELDEIMEQPTSQFTRVVVHLPRRTVEAKVKRQVRAELAEAGLQISDKTIDRIWRRGYREPDNL